MHSQPYNLTGIKLPAIFQRSVEIDQQIRDEHLLDLFASRKLVFLVEHLLDGIFSPLILAKNSLYIRIVHEFITLGLLFPFIKLFLDGRGSDRISSQINASYCKPIGCTAQESATLRIALPILHQHYGMPHISKYLEAVNTVENV